MKLKFKLTIALCILCACLTGCDPNRNENDDNNAMRAVCHNGQFIGHMDNGVIAFKGIPYAKAPVGDLRWKAPQRAENCNDVIDAGEYGKSGIQYYWHSEPITTACGEDCLTLNVWTSGLDSKGKTVMVWFHGGAYAWGGSSEPIYDGRYIVAAHPDVVLVTCNYRIGILGFANFSSLPGGEAFPDAPNLGVLDTQMALEWIQENIQAFGGDKDNVTIFGESAGGGLVTSLLATDAAGTLFHRAIVESGAANLTMSAEQSEQRIGNVMALQAVTGATSMSDLMALTEEQLIAANETPLDEDGNTLNDILSTPVRGTGLIAADIYEAMRNSQAKDVDLLIGTNLDEMAYWIAEMGETPVEELDDEEFAINKYIYEEYYMTPMFDYYYEKFTPEERQQIDQYIALYEDELGTAGARTRLLSDCFYRQPSIAMAEKHAGAGAGKTYMYMYERRNDRFEELGACHSAELPYVFMTPNETGTYGTYDPDFAAALCGAWVNFAKTGQPGMGWNEYEPNQRQTMVFGNDGTSAMKSDPYSQERQLSAFTVSYGMVQTEG